MVKQIHLLCEHNLSVICIQETNYETSSLLQCFIYCSYAYFNRFISPYCIFQYVMVCTYGHFSGRYHSTMTNKLDQRFDSKLFKNLTRFHQKQTRWRNRVRDEISAFVQDQESFFLPFLKFCIPLTFPFLSVYILERVNVFIFLSSLKTVFSICPLRLLVLRVTCCA